MDRHEIKELALLALDDFAGSALRDPSSYAGGRNAKAAVEEAVSALRKRVEGGGEAVNPGYRRQDELAATLIVIAATMPDDYARLMAKIVRYPEQANPGVLPGLDNLNCLLQAMGDDHDYVVVTEDEGPTLYLDGQVPHFVPLATPMRLLEQVETILDKRPAAPTP